MHGVATTFTNKIHRYIVGSFLVYHLPTSRWFFAGAGWTPTQQLFFRRGFLFKYLKAGIINTLDNFSLYSTIFRIKWFRFVLFAGLGYKRRHYGQKNIMLSYIGDRHWILYKFDQFSTVVPTKKRNFIFFSTSKNSFSTDYGFFASLRKPYVYKMKGFLDRRVKRRFLFVRRIKIRGLKMKLSKKQLML